MDSLEGEKAWAGTGGEDRGNDHPHRDRTEAIIPAALRMQQTLGPGLLEDACKVCLAHPPRLDGHEALQEVHADIPCEGLRVPGSCIMDITVDAKGAVEAKAVEPFSAVNVARLDSRLPFSSFEVGLPLHFHDWPPRDGGLP